MSQVVLLNNIEHKSLKIITDRSAELGDNLMYSLVVPTEFRQVQAHYPIFFRKDSVAQSMVAVALFGFEQGENLFLHGSRWAANYVPLNIQRQPFLIGMQKTSNGELTPVIHVDMASPRVNNQVGESVFLEFGGNSDFLERMAKVLELIHQGIEVSKEFYKTLNQLELFESIALDIELNNGAKHQLVGFYTINEDKFNKLPAAQITQLHEQGWLEFIYMVFASHSHIVDLIAAKNQKLTAK